MDDKVGVATNWRGEVGIMLEGETKVPNILGGVESP